MIQIQLTKEQETILNNYAKLKNMSVEDCMKEIVFKQIDKEYEIELKKKELEKTMVMEKTRVLNIPNFNKPLIKEVEEEIKMEDIPEDFNILKEKDEAFFYNLMNQKLENASRKDLKYLSLILEKCNAYIFDYKAYDKKIYDMKELIKDAKTIFKNQSFIKKAFLYGDYLNDDKKENSAISFLVIFDDDSFGGLKYYTLMDELYNKFHKQIEIMTDDKFISDDLLLIYKREEYVTKR